MKRARHPGPHAEIETFAKARGSSITEGPDGSPVFMAPSAWDIFHEAERWPGVKFADIGDCQREHA